MSLVNDAGDLLLRRADSKLLELRIEANRCRSLASCVIFEETRLLLEARAAAYDRQVRELQANCRRCEGVRAKRDGSEELA